MFLSKNKSLITKLAMDSFSRNVSLIEREEKLQRSAFLAKQQRSIHQKIAENQDQMFKETGQHLNFEENITQFLPNTEEEENIKKEIKFFLLNDCTIDEMEAYSSMEFQEQVFLILSAINTCTKDLNQYHDSVKENLLIDIDHLQNRIKSTPSNIDEFRKNLKENQFYVNKIRQPIGQNFKSIFDRNHFDFQKQVGEKVGFYLDIESTEKFRENETNQISLTEQDENNRPLNYDNFFDHRIIFRGVDQNFAIPGTVLGIFPGVVRLKRDVVEQNLIEELFSKDLDNSLYRLVNRQDGFILDCLSPIPFPMNRQFMREEDDIDELQARKDTIQPKTVILRKDKTDCRQHFLDGEEVNPYAIAHKVRMQPRNRPELVNCEILHVKFPWGQVPTELMKFLPYQASMHHRNLEDPNLGGQQVPMSLLVATDIVKDGDELFVNRDLERISPHILELMVERGRIGTEVFLHNDRQLHMDEEELIENKLGNVMMKLTARQLRFKGILNPDSIAINQRVRKTLGYKSDNDQIQEQLKK